MKRKGAARSACAVPWWRSCLRCGAEFRWERAWKGWWVRSPTLLLRGFICLYCGISTVLDAEAVFRDVERTCGASAKSTT